MKKPLLAITITLAIVSIVWVPKIHRAKKNVEHSKEISIGMDKNEVVNIMGEPDSRRLSYFDESDSLYYYQPPFGASSGIEFIIGPDGMVKQILPYE